MTWDRWTLFLLTSTLLSLSPGPAVLLVLARGLTGGMRQSLWAGLGILIGDGIYFVLSATGLGALLAASYEVFQVVKWVGAVYLLYLGLAMIFGKSRALSVRAREAGASGSGGGDGWRACVDGIVLELANPKALLFFVVLLPQFIDAHSALAPQVFVLGVTSTVCEFFVLACYGAFAGRFHGVATNPRFARHADRVGGSFLIFAGVAAGAARRA